MWDNPISQKPNYIAVWLYLITHANYTDNSVIINNKKVTLKRGSFLGSISKIATHFNLTRSTIKKIIDYFEGDGMLYTKRTRNYTVFIVKNYDYYQECVHQENTEKTPSEQRGATTKKDKKEKKEKKRGESPLFEDAVFYYNQMAERCGLRKAQKITQERKTKLKARLDSCGGIEGWNVAIEKVENSSFCRGQNDRNWCADLDFILQESSFVKIMEGKYDDRKKQDNARDELAMFLDRTGS